LSEFLERIQREISERLTVSRAAVREYERLEAALQALEGVGTRAVRAVSSRGGTQRASARASAPAGKQARAATGTVPSDVGGTAKRAAVAGRAGARRRSGANRLAGGATVVGRSASTRGRAPRGANRAAVLGVIGERPGVSARELAASSGVTGGTLYALLRTLAERGEIDKQELPSGHAGYTLTAAPTTAAPPGAQNASRPPVEETTSASAARPGGDDHDATPSAGEGSARAEAAASDRRPEGSNDTK
jgi:IclR helix-turn-helix domain